MAREIFRSIGVDIDAIAGWLGSNGGEHSPDDISRGMFSRPSLNWSGWWRMRGTRSEATATPKRRELSRKAPACSRIARLT